MTHLSAVRCVGGIVHDGDGRLLLIRRANEPSRGKWSIPGGRVEQGESDADAVRRELSEETGLEVEPGALIGTVTRGPFEIYDYACRVTAGVLTAGDDAAEARWVTAAEYDRLDRTGELVDALTTTLREWGALPRGRAASGA
ncbi:MAG: NUDIX hydrolase [Haloechinothrix sp.]